MCMKTVYMGLTALLIMCGFYFFLPAITFAQAGCGNIIAPENWFDVSSSLQTSPIQDCNNPFDTTINVDSPYTLKINDVAVHDSDTIQVSEDGTQNYEVDGRPYLSGVNHLFFLHDGDDYRYVDTTLSEPKETDYRALAEEFFTAGTDIEPFIAAIIDRKLSWEMDEATLNLFFEYTDYVDQNFIPQLPLLRAGTYTLVSKEYQLILTKESFLHKLFAHIIPTAHAQTIPDYNEFIFTLTFTITEPSEPQGVSNILFLPGIQASRLYKGGLLGSEDQVWPPSANFGQDIRDLRMSTDGLSEKVIYTRDVIDSSLGVGSVYGGFLDFLEELTTAPVPMKEFTSFAYDWRYDVFDIVEAGAPYENELKSLVEEVTRLSGSSYTGKVTIVAHSNGGLLAKALLTELEEADKDDLVDRVIFLASPQLGTPKAIGTILHGYDQSDGLGGVVTDADVAREVINNMPGAYGLLPSEKYLVSNGEPLVIFEESSETSSYRLKYGNSISSFADYKQFLLGTENNTNRTLSGDVAVPAKANESLLQIALDNHRDKLDSWVAPDGVEVIEIVGTGLPTMRGIEYRTITEGEDCVSTGGPAICTPRKFLKPYAQLTKYGDQTVVQTSASAYEKEKDIFYVDLSEIKKDFPKSKYKHYNLTEIAQIQDLITRIELGTSTENIDYISTSKTTFSDEYDIEIIDSPVHMLAEDNQGNQTGVIIVGNERQIIEDIPMSQYFEFGDTKYLVIPKDTEHQTTLFGESTGGYGLTIARLGTSNSQTILHQFQNATVTPDMVAMYAKKDGAFTTITTDLNGDGVIDRETTIDGGMVRYTYSDLRLVIKTLGLTKAQGKIVTNLVALAEQAGKQKTKYPNLKIVEKVMLKQLIAMFEIYKSHKQIKKEEYQKLERIITSIING